MFKASEYNRVKYLSDSLNNSWTNVSRATLSVYKRMSHKNLRHFWTKHFLLVINRFSYSTKIACHIL